MLVLLIGLAGCASLLPYTRVTNLMVLSKDGMRIRAYLEDLEGAVRTLESEVAALRAGVIRSLGR